jgi:hypothetical protein
MKKKIRIITDNTTPDQGTFLEDLNSHSFQNLNSQREDKTSSSSTVSDNMANDKYKKKKVMQKKNNNKTNLGLKYTNPSQRNHSSIYE